MCAIAGIIARRPVNLDAVRAMTTRMAHRGPDGEGFWSNADKHVCFGHRRLAIMDLSDAGSQPMTDATGKYVISFNGEVYNYLEIRKKLQMRGVSFRSKCDTEVLLEAYKLWGKDCVYQLNGMFSFSIYDKNKGTVFCARDRFGEKPFLFVKTRDYVAFASEYKALFSLKGISSDFNETLLLRFLDQPRQGLDDLRETLFKDISQLLPAERMTIDLRSLDLSIECYWRVDPTLKNKKLSDDDASGQLYDILEDAVRIRMRSDKPVGTCLSGGLDSSSIVSLNRKILGANEKYNTFTGIFPGSSTDETEFAKLVSDKFNLTGHFIEPKAKDFVDNLESFIWSNELPVGSSSQYAQWSVFRLAKNTGISVLLDGQGADEVLGGYEQYFSEYLEAISQFQSKKEVALKAARIKERYPLAVPNLKNKNFLPIQLKWVLANLSGNGSNFLFGVSRDIANKIHHANKRDLDKRFNPLSRALKDDALHAHLPTLLRYGDRNSMAHSLEIRLPFCDHRIIEFSLSLDPEQLMGKTQTKFLLRKAMEDILPRRIQTRWNKQGFLPPQQNWFKTELHPLISDLLASAAFCNRGYWKVGWWQKVLTRLQNGEGHLATPLWKIFISEMWHMHFVDRLNREERVGVFE